MAVGVVGTLTACNSSSPTVVLDSVPTTADTTTIPITLPSTTHAPITASTVTTATGATTATSGATTISSPVGASTTLPALTPENAPLLTWNGKQQYMHGANLPWFNFGSDFGGGPTGGGASSPESKAAVSVALGNARAAGMNVVRWWLFPGNPNQFVLDAAGLPIALADNVYVDVDAALQMAKDNKLSYVFTLFSAPTALPAPWITTDVGRQRLAQVLGDFFAHYRGNPQIMTWDIINEPEFDIWENKAKVDDVRAFITTIATTAHATSDAPVTVGGARLDGLPILTELGLDYYTIHWYDPMTANDQCLACVTYVEVRDAFKIDKPVVVGEFYGPVGLGDRFALWRSHGYAGSMVWSLLPDRTADHFDIDFAAATAFAATIGG